MSKVPGGVITFGVLDILFSLLVFFGGIASIIVVGVTMSALNLVFGGGLGANVGSGAGVSSLGIVSAIFYVVIAIGIFFGIFLFVTSVGLLRMKNWARVTMIAFSGLFIAFSSIGLIGSFVQSAGGSFPFMELIIFLLLLIVPVGQIAYFTRPGMKNHFS
jgi:hypothetical protein